MPAVSLIEHSSYLYTNGILIYNSPQMITRYVSGRLRLLHHYLINENGITRSISVLALSGGAGASTNPSYSSSCRCISSSIVYIVVIFVATQFLPLSRCPIPTFHSSSTVADTPPRGSFCPMQQAWAIFCNRLAKPLLSSSQCRFFHQRPSTTV